MHGPAAMLRLWHTVRHLKFVQVYGRARFRLARPRPDTSPAPAARLHDGSWVMPAARRASMVGPSTLRLLHVERSVDTFGWDDPTIAKLWRYNLHYFDDLLADGASTRTTWHRAFMSRWVRENPPASGTGWEPYPTSLRIVNWVKWTLAGNDLPVECAQSLAIQARWLRQRLEWHLLGNHLFVNAKALVFAGCFFDGPEADAWLAEGLSILRVQIPEQILADGGQFERSPMYHALALEDMLDLENLARMFPTRSVNWRGMVQDRIASMRHWLGVMCHPDGEVSFFNDSAIGVAPAPAELDAYAQRLGLEVIPQPGDGCTLLSESGFVRMQAGPAVVIADVGPVGPDYLPGHAHADTLSFELSLDGKRVLVNSGTSEYGIGAERLRQRGTEAHNTVTVGGHDSSEVWGGFRVARRAQPVDRVINSDVDPIRVSCSHDGFVRLAGRPIHRRDWTLTPTGLTVTDTIVGPGKGRSFWHWMPGIHVLQGSPIALTDRSLRVTVNGAVWSTGSSTWHPEFGVLMSNERSCAEFSGRSCTVSLDWT